MKMDALRRMLGDYPRRAHLGAKQARHLEGPSLEMDDLFQVSELLSKSQMIVAKTVNHGFANVTLCFVPPRPHMTEGRAARVGKCWHGWSLLLDLAEMLLGVLFDQANGECFC